jgi:nucleoside-diphosphate-sugar epimerase
VLCDRSSRVLYLRAAAPILQRRVTSIIDGLGIGDGIPVRDIIGKMRAAVAPGQQDLDGASIQLLNEATSLLLEARRDEAIAEYERFLGVAKRELSLPGERLATRLGGAVVLVTGGTGCIGSALVSQLEAFRPARIVSVSRGVTDSWPRQPYVEYAHADLRDRAAVESLIGDIRPDVIFHVASQRDPGLAETQVHQTVTTNVFGTRNVLEAAADAATGHVVCASTGKALRPFSPDTYTASKRVAEWVAADAAESNGMVCSAVRFTHVVDNSIIHRRLQEWAASSAVIRLHSLDIAFYVQSAIESAQLLLLASLDAQPDQLLIHAINDLSWPVSLLDVALGVLAITGSDAPIYISGYDPGYEEVAFPGLYDPATAGEVSPLMNAFETAVAVPSNGPMTDAFWAAMKPEPRVVELLTALRDTCDRPAGPDEICAALRELSWALLDATLAAAPFDALARAAAMARGHATGLTPDHRRILEAIENSVRRR